MNVHTPRAPIRTDIGTDVDVDRAMRRFAEGYDSLTALRLESCIHCGMCADACHYYLATDNPDYTPILKAEPLKQAYKREASPYAPIYRLLGLKKKVTAEELADWQELVFDSCNLCGRCSLICPMGIDVAALIEQTRQGMFEAGLAPRELYEKAEKQAATGQLDEPLAALRAKLESLAQARGLPLSIDQRRAEILVCLSELDLKENPHAVAALLKVLAHIGADYTFSSDCLIAENYGYLAGGKDWQRAISRRVIDAAAACGASTVVIPECGHGYTALRWEAAELDGKPLPFEVLHVTELMANALAAGKLRLRRANGGSVTFHDPCQVVRKGGAGKAPRALLQALGLPLLEQSHHVGFGLCCGGGGGVLDIERARPLRLQSIQPKLAEIDATGADQLVVSCSGCRATFADAAEHFHWNKSPQGLLELVADQLDESGGIK